MFSFGPPIDFNPPPTPPGGYKPIVFNPPSLRRNPPINLGGQPPGLQPGDTWEDAQGITHIVPGLPPPVVTQSAAQLQAAIQANGGRLSVWTSDVKNTPELQVAAANPSLFKVVAGAQPGEYQITLKTAGSAEPLGGYLPYILGGAGLLVVLSMLKR